MKLLEGKVCLVTGTSKGIGAATVRRFVEEGAIVYANDREVGSLDEICNQLKEEYNTEVYPVYFDVRDEAEAKKVFLSIKKQYGKLDVLVNNAGIMKDMVIGMINRQLMEDVFDVNVFAVMNMIQLANKLMSRQKSGSIINMTSIVGVEGSAGQMVYSASKGAVMAVTKSAAKELAHNNVRVNAIAPGMIDTDLFRSIGEDGIKENLANIKMGRLGTPTDVANAILFLASDLSSYVTGEILGVDGAALV